MVLEKTLESPLDCKEIQPVHPKEISPGCSLEGVMLKLKLQYFGPLVRRVDSLEKTLMLGGIRGRRRRGRQRMRWPKSWSFSFSIIPSKEHPGLISLGWTGWLSLKSKGLPRVFSNTTVQTHQFFGAQPSSQSNSHIHM